MKDLFRKLGLRRLDEMERAIHFKSQRNAYLFLVFALAARSLYASWRVYAYHERLNPFPCFLLCAAMLIQIFSRLILTRGAVKDNEDSCETGPLVQIIVLTCALAAVIAAALAALILTGVRL